MKRDAILVMQIDPTADGIDDIADMLLQNRDPELGFAGSLLSSTPLSVTTPKKSSKLPDSSSIEVVEFPSSS